MSITKGSRVGYKEEWQKGQGWSRRKSGKKTSFISHPSEPVLVPSPFREQLAPAARVFWKKPSALFPAGWEHISLLFLCSGDAGRDAGGGQDKAVHGRLEVCQRTREQWHYWLWQTRAQSKLPVCLEAKQHQLGSQSHNGFSLSVSLTLIARTGCWWWRNASLMEKGEKAEGRDGAEESQETKASRASCLSVGQCGSSHLTHSLQSGDEQHFQQFLAWAFWHLSPSPGFTEKGRPGEPLSEESSCCCDGQP